MNNTLTAFNFKHSAVCEQICMHPCACHAVVSAAFLMVCSHICGMLLHTNRDTKALRHLQIINLQLKAFLGFLMEIDVNLLIIIIISIL